MTGTRWGAMRASLGRTTRTCCWRAGPDSSGPPRHQQLQLEEASLRASLRARLRAALRISLPGRRPRPKLNEERSAHLLGLAGESGQTAAAECCAGVLVSGRRVAA